MERDMFSRLSKAIKWIGDHFKGLLFVLILAVLFMPTPKSQLIPPNLQEIKLTGAILDASEILNQIEQAQKDPNIKGVLLNVNSPGGSVPPSIEISYAIANLAKSKPVVAYASGVMASGSYYSSIYANKIIANPGAIVGSIGVIMQSANIKELLDKIGIKPQTIKEGLYKEAGTPTREWTPAEREELKRLTGDTYRLFVSDVAKARGLDINKSDQFANAHIFSAKRAKEVGLIDEIGIISQAKSTLTTLAKVKNPRWKQKDKLEKIIDKLTQKTFTQIQSYLFGLKSEIGF
jgi:protease-4